MDTSNHDHMLLDNALRGSMTTDLDGELDATARRRGARLRKMARRRQRRAERRDVIAQAMLDYVCDMWTLPDHHQPFTCACDICFVRDSEEAREYDHAAEEAAYYASVDKEMAERMYEESYDEGDEDFDSFGWWLS